jgi:DNA-binding NarL/FixJ family response regulator
MAESAPALAKSISTKRRIMIVDDQPIVRQGLARLMAHEPDLELCGGAEDAKEALEAVQKLRPDLVVVDLSLKNSHGLELIKQIKAFDKSIKVLVWSMFDELLFAERSLRAGAGGYIDKQEPVEKVIEAIRHVLCGEVCVSARMTNRLLCRMGGGEVPDQDPIHSLSDRELEVFELIGRGMTIQQIAARSQLSVKTVEGYRENVKKKLDLKNSAELARRAVQWMLERR